MVNKVILIGNLGRDPEVRFTSGGQAVCALRLATSQKWKDKQSGQQKEETTWFDVEVWGAQAEACGQHLAKGRQVFVEGRLKVDQWEKDGQKRERTKVVAESVKFLSAGPREARPAQEREQSAPDPEAGAGPDGIPF